MTTEEFKNSIIPFCRKLYPMLFRILKNEEETKDAVQELMVKLWNKRNDLKNCKNQSAYIITMAKNYSFDLLKKKRPVTVGEQERHKILNLQSSEVNTEIREKYDHVHKSIEKLPEKYKIVIRSRDIDGLTFDEIKEMTGFEVPYIRVILSRARLKVKQEVEKIYDYENEKQLARQIL